MHDKEIWVEFSEDANNDYRELQKKVLQEREQGIENSFNMQLLKSIDKEKDNVKIDPQYGTDRLWKVDLVGYWRMIYTITGDEVKIIAFVLEFMDHKKYNKIFGYKKK